MEIETKKLENFQDALSDYISCEMLDKEKI